MLDIDPNNTPSATLRRMLILLLAALVLAFGLVARADSVHLYDQIGVKGATVTLGEIAELKGQAALKHADLVVMELGDGRDEKTITLSTVSKALDKAGVNWGLVSLRGFNECRVTRLIEPEVVNSESGQAVSANVETPIGLNTSLTLRGMVEELLAERAGATLDQIQVSYSARDAKLLDTPILSKSVEIEPTMLNTLGNVPIAVRLYEGQRVVESFTITAKVKCVMLAVVSSQRIARGDRYSRDNVEVRECIVDSSDITPITDPSLVYGQQASMSLNADQLITVRAVRPPVLIKRGDLVTVRCFIGGLIVKTVGIAKQDGALDEVIEIKNDTTHETYLATVTGSKQAVVSIGGGASESRSVAAADTDQEAVN